MSAFRILWKVLRHPIGPDLIGALRRMGAPCWGYLIGGVLLLAFSFLFNLVWPVFVWSTFSLTAAALALLPVRWLSNSVPARAIGGALVCGILALHFVDWNTRVAFIRALNNVGPGMKRAAVEREMAPFLKGVVEYQASGSGLTALVFRHYHAEALDQDWDGDQASIFFDGDRVDHISFYPGVLFVP